MEKIFNASQLLELQNNVRSQKKGFISNFYYDQFKHNIWVTNGDLFYEIIGDTLFFLRNSETFSNIFYSSFSIDTLSRDLKIFSSNHCDLKLMFDIVGRNEQCMPLIDVFKNNGYSETVSLVRMVRKTEQIAFDENFSKVNIATKDQAKEVFSLLHKYFVAENEQIPYLEELEYYASLGHIHVYKESNKVIGFMIFEKNASTLYWRYWFVHPDYRERHIGSLLFHRLFFEANETKRQLLWVIRTNENAKKRQEHYGFSEENMYDYVFTNKINNTDKTIPISGGGKYLIFNNLYLTTCKAA